jgi:Zn-dependent peptidase ImmA (M78 family)
MNTTEKGNTFESQVFEIIQDLLDDGSLYIDGKKSKIFSKKAYFSKERNGDIITDISIETFIKNSDKYSLLTILECKDLSKPVPVDDLEEFDSKLRQLGEHNLKGILISKSGFQKGALNFSKSKGIALINIKENKKIEWINYRKDNIQKQYDSISIEEKLQNVNSLDTNFFALYNFKSFDYFPILLIEFGIIDSFQNKPKYFNLPYLEEKQICYIVDPYVKQDFYNNDALDFDKLCQYLNTEMNVKFEFDQQMTKDILGKMSINPLKISLNPNLKAERCRWRFTLAHEIGHLILHKEFLEKYVLENIDKEDHITLNFADSIQFNKRLEIQANLFAGELLMPITLLINHVNKYFEDENINEGYLYLDNQPCNQTLVFNFLRILQMKFDVSQEVSKIRLINLKLLQDTTDNSLRSILKRMF